MTEKMFESNGPLRGRIRVPGDKSISHRALMLAARAEGESTITGLSNGEDVAHTRAAMSAIGAHISELEGRVTVEGGANRLGEPASDIYLGNSGTGMRLLTGYLSGLPGQKVLTGDESLSRRPMKRVVEPLRLMGADISGGDNGNFAPLIIGEAQLRGIDYTPPVASAQVKSSILLAGLDAEGDTVVREPVATRMHTEEMLEACGADIDIEESADGVLAIRLRRSKLNAIHFDVPGDPSQAAFWMVAALLLPDSDITLENVYLGPGRGGIVEVLVRMGADIDLAYLDGNTADIRVRCSKLTGTEVSGEEIPALIDELPILALAATAAEGETVVTDAAEMRVKESDRIAAVVSQLSGLGGHIKELSDGFVVTGSQERLRGGRVDAKLDHRIAMVGAVAGLISDRPVTVSGWDSVDTSYPNFTEDLTRLETSTL